MSDHTDTTLTDTERDSLTEPLSLRIRSTTANPAAWAAPTTLL